MFKKYPLTFIFCIVLCITAKIYGQKTMLLNENRRTLL